MLEAAIGATVTNVHKVRLGDIGAGRSEGLQSALTDIDANGPKPTLVAMVSNGSSQPGMDI